MSRSLSRTTVLQRVGDVVLRIDSSNHVTLSSSGRSVTSGPHTLAVLDAFHTPRTFEEAVARLTGPRAGAQTFVDVTSTIVQLFQAGLLRDVATGGILTEAPGWRFDAPGIHVAMLGDVARTEALIRAIRDVVRPGDVVVEIGTGTGILSVAAAQAGAKRVYAIESGQIGNVAAGVFAANGVADRVQVVSGWSTDVELPERADVLVTEIVGDEPFGEQMLDVLADARRRLLAPRARIIPSAIDVHCYLASAPAAVIREHAFCREDVEDWARRYGVELSPLLAANPPCSWTRVKRDEIRRWRPLTPPAPLARVDLATFPSPVLETDVMLVADTEGQASALVSYFDLHLAPGVTLETHPLHVDDRHHWRYSVLLWTDPRTIHPGEVLRARYRYDGCPMVKLVP